MQRWVNTFQRGEKDFPFFNSIVQLKVSNITIKTSFRSFSLSDLFLFQIFQILELPSETDRLETHQVLKRGKKKIKKKGCEHLFLWNSRDCVFWDEGKLKKSSCHCARRHFWWQKESCSCKQWRIQQPQLRTGDWQANHYWMNPCSSNNIVGW